jgi:hypothetical protein
VIIYTSTVAGGPNMPGGRSGSGVREFGNDRGMARLRRAPAGEPAPPKFWEQRQQIGPSQQVVAVFGHDILSAAVWPRGGTD